MLLANEFDDPNLNAIENTEDIDSRIETLWELINKCEEELSSIKLED